MKNRIGYIVLLLLMLGACKPNDPLHSNFSPVENAQYFKATTETVDTTVTKYLRVATYNIKFGAGRIDMYFDCIGNRRDITEAEVKTNLDRIASALDTIDADVVFLQEVDLQSKRTAYVNQVEYLLNHTSFNEGYYASHWKSDFIPSDGLGRMNSGIAILSKLPLSDGQRIALPQMEEQSKAVRYFYLKRAILSSVVQFNGKEVVLMNTHLTAYDEENVKHKQLNLLQTYVEGFGDAPLIFGGDLNTVPPGTDKLNDFEDGVCDSLSFPDSDYAVDTGKMDVFYENWEPAISLNLYQANQSRYFTHSMDKEVLWTRKLDYLFTNMDKQANSGKSYYTKDKGGVETMSLSDHCPVSMDVKY